MKALKRILLYFALGSFILPGAVLLGLTGCVDDNEALPAQNVTDELLICDLSEFSNSIGGKLKSDWRKLGSDGIEVSAVEDGVDASYSFTREAGSKESLERLEFAKTITVNISSGKALRVVISESYNASSKRIEIGRTSYFIVDYSNDANSSDESTGAVSNIDEENAIALMNQCGRSQTIENTLSSPIEYFVNAYFEYDTPSPYSY